MISRNLRVTLIEDDIVWGDRDANIKQLERNLRNMPEDTDLVILPELFTTGFMTGDRDQAAAVAEWNSGDTLRILRKLADEFHVGIIGSFLANTAAQLYNRAFFIEPNGDETYYDKRHLFSFGGEDKVFNQGHTAAPIVRFRGFNIKLVVCYDLRFPVFCRNVNNNYDLMVVIANWPKSREKVWRTLLAARAIEYPEGSSLVIDFKGKIMAQRMNSPLISAELSPAQLTQFREKFPAWRDADPFTLNI